MTDKQIIIDDLKEMIYKLQIECAEKTDNILALGDQLKTAETVIEILEAKIGGNEYAISDIVKEYQGKLDQLKEQLEAYKMEAEEGYEINAELKAENEELKKQNNQFDNGINEQFSKIIELEGRNNLLKAELEQEKAWHKSADEISKVNSEYTTKLKQTLAEIKEICNNNDELKGNFNLVDCDKYKLGKHNLAQKIIAKINEVDNES